MSMSVNQFVTGIEAYYRMYSESERSIILPYLNTKSHRFLHLLWDKLTKNHSRFLMKEDKRVIHFVPDLAIMKSYEKEIFDRIRLNPLPSNQKQLPEETSEETINPEEGKKMIREVLRKACKVTSVRKKRCRCGNMIPHYASLCECCTGSLNSIVYQRRCN